MKRNRLKLVSEATRPIFGIAPVMQVPTSANETNGCRLRESNWARPCSITAGER